MKKTTKRALFLSFAAMFLCFTMLLGTTYAWFTDSVESGVNQIVAGNLDVELYNALADDIADANKVDGTTKLFDKIELWEPGAVVYENLTVANEGTLALKYQLGVEIAKANVTKDLSEVLKVAVVENGITTDDRAALLASIDEDDWQPMKSFIEEGKLEASTTSTPKTKTYGIVIYWEPSDKDNDYNMNNDKGEALELTIGVNLYATQLDAEDDSFGPDYDEDAWHEKFEVVSADALQAAINNGEQNIILNDDITATESIVIGAVDNMSDADDTVVIDLNGKTISGAGIDAEGKKVHTIINYGTLVIKNGTVESTGTNGGSAIYNMGTLTLDNVKVNGAPSDTAKGTASYAINNDGVGTTLVANNVTVSGRGAIGVTKGAKVEINGGTYHTPAVAWGHAVYAADEGTEVVINGGTFSEGYEMAADNWGMYQIYSGNKAKVTVNGGTFMPWDCANGYDLCTSNGGTIVINGGTFAEDPSNQNKSNYVAKGYIVNANDDGSFSVVPRPGTAKVSYRAYILNSSRKAIQIDMENIYARESLVIELWYNDTLLTTTTYAGSYPFEAPGYTTCCVAMPGSAFFSWDTVIADGVTLTADNIPNMIKVYADGVLVDTFTHASGTVLADKVNDYIAILPQ